MEACVKKPNKYQYLQDVEIHKQMGTAKQRVIAAVSRRDHFQGNSGIEALIWSFSIFPEPELQRS